MTSRWGGQDAQVSSSPAVSSAPRSARTRSARVPSVSAPTWPGHGGSLGMGGAWVHHPVGLACARPSLVAPSARCAACVSLRCAAWHAPTHPTPSPPTLVHHHHVVHGSRVPGPEATLTCASPVCVDGQAQAAHESGLTASVVLRCRVRSHGTMLGVRPALPRRARPQGLRPRTPLPPAAGPCTSTHVGWATPPPSLAASGSVVLRTPSDIYGFGPGASCACAFEVSAFGRPSLCGASSWPAVTETRRTDRCFPLPDIPLGGHTHTVSALCVGRRVKACRGSQFLALPRKLGRGLRNHDPRHPQAGKGLDPLTQSTPAVDPRSLKSARPMQSLCVSGSRTSRERL